MASLPQIGEQYDVTIEAVGEKGDGIARINGFVIFVPNVKRGDNVKIKVTKVLSKVGFGEVVGKSTGQSAQSSYQRQEFQRPKEPEYKDSEDFGDDLED